MKKTTKTISILLALLMLVGVMSVTVVNAGENEGIGFWYYMRYYANDGSDNVIYSDGVTVEPSVSDCTFNAPDGKKFKCWKNEDGTAFCNPGDSMKEEFVSSYYNNSYTHHYETTYSFYAVWEDINPVSDKKGISSCTVSGIKAKTYNGKAQTQSVTVKDGSKTLKSGTDYTVSYKNNKNAGKATMTIKGKGNYKGSVNKTFKINKAANPMTVSYKKSVNAKADKKTTIKKAVTVNKAQGTVTYKTNNKKITVKKGTMTVAKGLKKNKTYAVKVTVNAEGNKNYNSLNKTVTIKVKVK